MIDPFVEIFQISSGLRNVASPFRIWDRMDEMPWCQGRVEAQNCLAVLGLSVEGAMYDDANALLARYMYGKLASSVEKLSAECGGLDAAERRLVL